MKPPSQFAPQHYVSIRNLSLNLPCVSSEIVNGDLTIFPLNQLLEDCERQIEIKCIRMVEVVVVCICMVLLAMANILPMMSISLPKPFVEGIQ